MKHKLIIILTLWICFLLQSSVLSYLNFLGVVPNLLLITTVSMGFMHGKNEGIFTGFIAGLLLDISYGGIIGIYALLYMYIGYVSGFFTEVYFSNVIRVPVCMVTVFEFIYDGIIFVAGFLLRWRTNFWGYFTSVVFPDVLITALFTFILYSILYRVNRSYIEQGKKGRQSLWIRD